MPSPITLRRDHAVRLLWLLLVVATLSVLAVPMCAEDAFGNDIASMSGSTTLAASEPVESAAVHHCAGHDCTTSSATPSAASSGTPGSHGNVLMSCILLLMAVLVAALRAPEPQVFLRPLIQSLRAAPRPDRALSRFSRQMLCIARI